MPLTVYDRYAVLNPSSLVIYVSEITRLLLVSAIVRFHKFFDPDIKDAWLDSIPPAKVTKSRLPTEPFQNDSLILVHNFYAHKRECNDIVYHSKYIDSSRAVTYKTSTLNCFI